MKTLKSNSDILCLSIRCFDIRNILEKNNFKDCGIQKENAYGSAFASIRNQLMVRCTVFDCTII